MGTRFTDSRVTGHYSYTDYNPNGSSSGGGGSGYDRKGSGDYKYISDVSTPNYARRKAAGEVIMNPVTIMTENRVSTPVSWSFGNHPVWGTRTFSGDLALYVGKTNASIRPSWYTVDVGRAKTEAINNAFAKAYSSDAQLLVTMAEAKKTLDMLRNPFGTARELIDKINWLYGRKLQGLSDTRKAWDAAQAFASAWNEYRFGWKPVLYDIQNIQKAYASAVSSVQPERLVFRAGSKLQYNNSGAYNPTVPGLTSCQTDYSFACETKVSAGVIISISPGSNYHSAANRFGLSLNNVPASIWELVPYSFVVDRFVRVGSWLQANIPSPGTSVLGSWCSTVDEYTLTCNVLSGSIFVANAPATTYTQGNGGSYVEHIKTLERTVGHKPSLIPALNTQDLSISQWVDHAALILQRLQGFRPKKF